jgi:hypothetical protein
MIDRVLGASYMPPMLTALVILVGLILAYA